jgi:H+/Cl- antiporter ClcA
MSTAVNKIDDASEPANGGESDEANDPIPRNRQQEHSDTTRPKKETGGEHSEMLDLLGPAYARSSKYWKAILYSAVLNGLFMGAVSLSFVLYFTELSNVTWHSGAYRAALEATSFGSDDADAGASSSVDPLLLGNGHAWYIGMSAGAGLIVGIIKCLWTYLRPSHPFPDKIPGFLKEVQELKSEDVLLSLPVLVASGLSIGFGASVGPEAALSGAGAAFGTFIQRQWAVGGLVHHRSDSDNGPGQEQRTSAMAESQSTTRLGRFCSTVLPDFRNDRLCVVDGMAASFAGLFPAQFLSPLLIYELGGHFGPGGQLSVTETIARSGIASTVAYALYVSVKGVSLLASVQLPVAAYEVVGTFQLVWVAYAWFMGIVCGLVGFIGFMCLAIGTLLGKFVTKQLNALGDKLPLPFDGFLGKLLSPVIGGVLVGALAVAAPLVLGDGSLQIGTILTRAEEIGVATLIGTGLIKLVAFGISLGFGFVGGPFFPIIFVGACTGSIVHLLVPDVPLVIAYSCCLVGVPSAILPGFFFMTSVAATTLVLGGPATTAVFFTVIVSYSTVCGMGIVQNLLLKAARKEEAQGTHSSSDGAVDDHIHHYQDGSSTLNPLLQRAWEARPTGLNSIRNRRRPSPPSADLQPASVKLSASPLDDASSSIRNSSAAPGADASQLTSFSV